MTAAVLAALGLLALTSLLHFAIGRAARRAPRWLAARTVLWLGAAWVLTERIEPLMRVRGSSRRLLVKAFCAPLFSVNERAYSALDVLPLPVLLVALWLVVGLCVRAVRSRLLEAVGVESGLQETLAILLRYSLTFVGAIVLL